MTSTMEHLDLDLELILLIEENDKCCHWCSEPATRELTFRHLKSHPDCSEYTVKSCDNCAEKLWARARDKVKGGPGTCPVCHQMIWCAENYIVDDRRL